MITIQLISLGSPPKDPQLSIRQTSAKTWYEINIHAQMYAQLCFVAIVDGDDFGALHDLDFVMIKYPRKRNSNSLPHERVFTMDYENLVGKDFTV